MLFLKTGLFGLLLVLCASRSSAQTLGLARDANAPKAKLFTDLPHRMDVNAQLLAPLLQNEVGTSVQVPLATDFTLSGVVVSKSDAAEQRYKTVVIKATNRPGATFTVTAIRKSDGSYRYSGRMLSLKAADAYELVEDSGRLSLQKKELSELVSE